MHNINKEQKRSAVIRFLKKNPTATYRQLKEEGFDHLERLFKEGLKEAYAEMGIESPRTSKTRTIEERKNLIFKYIQEHPKAGIIEIRKATKVNPDHVFKGIKNAFDLAGVSYPQERLYKLRSMSKEEKKERIFNLIKDHPESTIQDIRDKTDINPYKIFKNLNEAYKEAGIKKINRHKKRRLRKQRIILDFIINNPTATQREVNKNCRTRIQGLFEGGIFGAYKEAGVEFPFERLNLHGSAINEVKKRARDFEEEIAIKLSCYGLVNRLVKTKRGKADIILERKGKKFIIEVKDYLNKEISQHEIKQLNKYLEDCNCPLGIIVCHTKPKRDTFLIDKNKIIILESQELNRIPEILDSR